MLNMTVKSVRLEEIMDYIDPKVAFIKVDAGAGNHLAVSALHGTHGFHPK